jgi:hypothetical protein
VSEASTDIKVRIASELHERGNSSVSLLVKHLLEQDFAIADDPALRQKNSIYAWASSTAVRWAPAIIPAFTVCSADDPSLLMNQAKYFSVWGDAERADSTLARAENSIKRISGRSGSQLRVALARTEASILLWRRRLNSEQVRRVSLDASRAERDAENSYTRSSALVQLGALEYRMGEDTIRRAYHRFEETLARPDLSLAYRAIAWFHQGIAELEWRSPSSDAYSHLVKAQYVFCMLGLLGFSNLSAERVLPGMNPADITPGQVLLRHPALAFRGEEATELRKQAIGERGRRGLWHDVQECLNPRVQFSTS